MFSNQWSSHFSTVQSSCVEVAGTLDALRDSKNPTGPVLRANVAEIVAVIRAGRLDPH